MAMKDRVRKGFDYHFYNWNKECDECTLSIVCFDNNPNPLECFTKEDLEVEYISRFGAKIIKENMRLRPRHLGYQHTKVGTYTGNPLLKKMDLCKRDHWEETFKSLISRPTLDEINSSFIQMSEDPKLRWLRDKRLKVDRQVGDQSEVEMAMLK